MSTNNDQELTYEELVDLCKDNIGTVIRIVDRDEERVWFSPHRKPREHATLLRAAVWETELPNLSGPRWAVSVGRGLEGMHGGISVVNDGNEHYNTYGDAVSRIEELAAEYDGEALRWRDLPKRCFWSTGEELTTTHFVGDEP